MALVKRLKARSMVSFTPRDCGGAPPRAEVGEEDTPCVFTCVQTPSPSTRPRRGRVATPRRARQRRKIDFHKEEASANKAALSGDNG